MRYHESVNLLTKEQEVGSSILLGSTNKYKDLAQFEAELSDIFSVGLSNSLKKIGGQEG